MEELLYLEVPTPGTAAVKSWLQTTYQPEVGTRQITPDGILLGQQEDGAKVGPDAGTAGLPSALSVMVWSVQRTTYLKVFRWGSRPLPQESQRLRHLERAVRQQFPPQFSALPEIDLSQQSIFEALAPHFPQTVKYFQRMPNGEADLTRAYWWEQRWRAGVRQPRPATPVVQRQTAATDNGAAIAAGPYGETTFDLIYIGGALGAIHAAVMAQLGFRVLLVERLPFSRMNREWNISRQEFQSLIDLGLFTAEEFEDVISREYADGFNKFFDANNPSVAQSPVLHTPTVLNIALNSEALLKRCGEKLLAAGGVIQDETDFLRAEVGADGVDVWLQPRRAETPWAVRGRLLVDAMGTASPIAWQLTGGRPYDSVCPTVGASISGGISPEVWDTRYGDVLFSHGDISRGRQLIWELFPGPDDELTVYLFHYHQVHPDNPGSLLEMYEDFFHILPEYRRCDLDQLTWRKATFGYIPGYFSQGGRDRTVAFDRLVAIGDAASMQSPLVFTGFGSLVRNLPRLTELLAVALRHDLLSARHLNQIRAYQGNVAVTWLFSKGMMVPTGQSLPPARVNSMLNTFFGILEKERPEVAERFIKDRSSWMEFNRMALRAAYQNPALLGWIWQLAGPKDMARWVVSYLLYTLQAFFSALFGWLPPLVQTYQASLERLSPGLYFWLLVRCHGLTYGMGQPPTLTDPLIRPADTAPAPAQVRLPSSLAAQSSAAGPEG